MARRTRARKSNPFDAGSALTPAISIGALLLVGVIGWEVFKNSGLGQTLGLGGSVPGGSGGLGGLFGGGSTASGGGGGAGGGGSTATITPCFHVPQGNTVLSLNVAPWNPAQVGADVVYSGQLQFKSGLPNSPWDSVPGATIEFWDANSCTAYQSTRTDSNGFFRLDRTLQADETQGYDMFAFFRGMTSDDYARAKGDFSKLGLGDLNPAMTGPWGIRPGA